MPKVGFWNTGVPFDTLQRVLVSRSKFQPFAELWSHFHIFKVVNNDRKLFQTFHMEWFLLSATYGANCRVAASQQAIMGMLIS